MFAALAVLTIVFVAAGHLVRDGWPATGSTQLARAIGGLLSVAGALIVLAPIPAAVVGAAIWLGFYSDQKHGAACAIQSCIAPIRFSSRCNFAIFSSRR